MSSQLAWGGRSGGGLDAPDPHQVAIERVAMSMGGNTGRKHIVLITNRPIHQTYHYNICNSNVRTNFGITTPNTCNTDPSLEADLARLHSERCANAYQALTNTYCRVGLTAPSHTFNVNRSADDAVTFAVMNDIAVTVVVPQQIDHRYKNETEVSLKKLAAKTGGLYLSYESFTKANYTNMLWRVLNHRPKKSPLAFTSNFSNDIKTEVLPFTIAKGATHKPILFSANATQSYESYSWDFNGDGTTDEVTKSPNTEYVYGQQLTNVFASVQGSNGSEVGPINLIPLNITNSQLPVVKEAKAPTLPEDITAVKSETNIELTWKASGASDEIVFVADASGLILRIGAASLGKQQIPNESSISTLQVWTENSFGRSQRVEIAVEEFTVPIAEEPDPPAVETPPEGTGGQPTNQNDNREPSDKIIQVSEENTLPESFNGAIVEVSPASSGRQNVTTSAQFQPAAATAQDLQGAGVTQVLGEETQTTGSQLQQAQSLSQAQLASEFDGSPKQDDPMAAMPLFIGGFVLVVVLAGAFVLLKVVKK